MQHRLGKSALDVVVVVAVAMAVAAAMVVWEEWEEWEVNDAVVVDAVLSFGKEILPDAWQK